MAKVRRKKITPKTRKRHLDRILSQGMLLVIVVLMIIICVPSREFSAQKIET